MSQYPVQLRLHPAFLWPQGSWKMRASLADKLKRLLTIKNGIFQGGRW